MIIMLLQIYFQGNRTGIWWGLSDFPLYRRFRTSVSTGNLPNRKKCGILFKSSWTFRRCTVRGKCREPPEIGQKNRRKKEKGNRTTTTLRWLLWGRLRTFTSTERTWARFWFRIWGAKFWWALGVSGRADPVQMSKISMCDGLVNGYDDNVNNDLSNAGVATSDLYLGRDICRDVWRIGLPVRDLPAYFGQRCQGEVDGHRWVKFYSHWKKSWKVN